MTTTTLEPFDLRAIAPQRWKNGAGITREIACEPRGAGTGRFDWRLSVAEVERAAPFSSFPGVDRCIVLLAGAGLHLRSRDSQIEHRLDTPLRPFHFAGEAAIFASPIAGPSVDFNAMTRRGHWHAEVSALHAAATLELEGVALLLCCEGEWHSDAAGLPLGQVGQGLLLREGQATVHLRPSHGPGAHEAPSVLVVRLCQDGR